jgi:hypothetical protein
MWQKLAIIVLGRSPLFVTFHHNIQNTIKEERLPYCFQPSFYSYCLAQLSQQKKTEGGTVVPFVKIYLTPFPFE